jgi:predicted dehydrogenase
VQAIASSTSREKSQAFAQRYVSSARTAPALYNSYEKLYDDPQVDVVYIATPNALHMQNALDSIKAGKHVLVEKPLAVTAKHAEKIVAAAQQRGVFLMEGL